LKNISFPCPPPSLGIPYKSENISQIYSGYILGYISDTSKIYLGYRCIPDISWIYPRCIPDVSQIYPTSRIYLKYIPDLSRMTDESGIHFFILNISGIQRLGDRKVIPASHNREQNIWTNFWFWPITLP
jgi:hypothetical protein